MDFKVTNKSIQVYLIVNESSNVISIGFGEWVLQESVFTYEWGMDETLALGNAVTLR